LFGQRAEIFGQFAFARATESGAFDANSTDSYELPGVNPTASGITGLQLHEGTGQTTFERSFTSYDGNLGMRLHIRNGAWSFSPGFYLGFQRTDLNESVVFPAFFAPSGVSSSVTSDYYQIGLALGTTYNLTPTVALFGMVQGGLDYVRSRYDGSSQLFFGGKLPLSGASASDRDNRLSGRVGLRAGLAFSPTSAITVSIGGLMQYIGSVSNVAYPQHPTATNTGLPTNGTVPARLGSESQLNFGAAVGATIRF